MAGYGLEGKEDELFRTEGIVFAFPKPEAPLPLSEIVQHLEQAYCGTMALEVAQVEVHINISLVPRPLPPKGGSGLATRLT